MKKIINIVLYSILFFFIGCDKSDPLTPIPLPPPPPATGTWNGANLIRVTLVDIDGNISGAGYIFGSLSLSVLGENRFPFIQFSIGNVDYEPAYFSGKFISLDTISGVLNGSGFRNQSIVLVKE